MRMRAELRIVLQEYAELSGRDAVSPSHFHSW